MRELPNDCVEIIDAYFDDVLKHTNAWCPDTLASLIQKKSLQQKADILVYWDARLSGCSRRLAEMLALQRAPLSNTDREFLLGHCNGNQFGAGPLANDRGNFYRKVAESEGQNVKGKVYISGLAAYPGDPRAWVSGRGDVQAVLEERNWSADGAVNRKFDGRESPVESTPTTDPM